MFGWSPPNILATLVLCFLLLLQFHRSSIQAKPYPKQGVLSTYTTGNLGGVHERDWPQLVNYKHGHYIQRNKRSPTEVEDETIDSAGEKTLNVKAGKRQGIETPIEPLTSNSGLDFSHLNTEENVRSKVDQPEGESVGVSVEEEKKGVDDSPIKQNQQESKKNDANSSTGQESSEGQKDEHVSSSNENANNDGSLASSAQDKTDASKESLNKDTSTENKGSESTGESKVGSSSSVDENAQVRSVQDGANQLNKLGSVPNDKSNTKSASSALPLENNQASSTSSSSKENQQQIQPAINNNVNNQQVNSDASTVVTTKAQTSGTITSSNNQNSAASANNSPSTKTQSQESQPINTVPQLQNAPAEPVRDALGNSGSEIVTTQSRRAPEFDSYTERDTEPKPANGPEVGHFQVDDKSADLEINANSAGVKVKAKPASLQVVSRPGSHPGSGAQERSLFNHYHYPPYHPHHHWYPGMRRSFGRFHHHHFFNPYRPFLERRGFDSFYDEAPFYRRRMHYWYPHRHRHRYRDSYLYERSRLEEPEEVSKYRRGRRHKRRFRHMNGPYRRQFYNNNIPIMSSMESPQMGMVPEEGTMPQLPIGPGRQFFQRQNIITPVPPPVNVFGNPPPGLVGGMNGANFPMNAMNGMNEMSELNNFNGMNQMNGAINGINGVNDRNSMGTMGFNSPEQMGAVEGLPAGMTGMEQAPGITRALGSRNIPAEAPRRAFKKTAILSGKTNNDSTKKEHSHNEKKEAKKKDSKEDLEMTHVSGREKKGNVNIKSWEKTLKRYHRLNTFASKAHEKHKFRRNAKSSSMDSEPKKTEEKSPRKHSVSHLHAQNAKDVKGKRKNDIVMHRPPIIYHPPPEIYHRPDIVVHRAPIMLHRPPIIYHQPPVVVHRPAIIYHQPPIVFHQPPPMVHQPILHSHDTWVTKPVVYHTTSSVTHEKTYYGIPSHVYAGAYGEGCHGGHCAYRKESVPHSNNTLAVNSTLHKRQTKRDSLSDYLAYFTSLWKANSLNKRDVKDEYDFITSSDGANQKLSYTDMNAGVMSKRDSESSYKRYLHSLWNNKVKRDTDDFKNGTEKKKKKDVVVNRPPIIYHPPPEIYHRPDIVVHRPPLVIHRPPIIYHQPPVIVHRPAVVYHQPPIVFHQPPPAVSQPLLYSHDSFTVHPSFYATHHGSVVRDFGHYVGVPNVITNYGNPLFGRPPIGKRSKIETPPSNTNATSSDKTDSTEAASQKAILEHHESKTKNESSEKAGKKNTVLVHRPPIIYHPPPEIYHRPIIVVHRPPIMIHRAPIFYHQPPVVVHRPAIVYHQPPLIFHQPPPMVHQPVLKSHDTWISHPVVVPYSSRVMHHHTYVGVPDAYTVHHFSGEHGFYKSHILKHSNHEDEHAFERNEISGEKNSTEQETDSSHKRKITSHDDKQNTTFNLKTKKAASQKGGKKNAVIVRRPPVIYHPPPEIYHRPEIVVHRAPIVIHRAPIIYHQPPVIVHRPAIVYHQPPLVFHQPPPVVHQPVYRSHDTYVHRPVVRLYSSKIHHAGHMYHVPHAYYHGHGGAIHYMSYQKSKVPQKENSVEERGTIRAIVKSKKGHKKIRTKKSSHAGRKHAALTRSKDKTETGIKLDKNHKILYHKAKETTEKANKKNSVVIHRPPIIYHPPPEIYHRPDIVVHRAPIVLYRAPIVYHQPPVVVHRPAIVYHQPPIVFHQPPPMVHQPVLHSHDTWVAKPVVVPYASHVRHIATYRGVPHEEIFMHGIGTGAFGKSRVPRRGSRRNEIDNVADKGKKQTSKDQTKTTSTDQGKNRTTRAVYDEMQRTERIGAAERIARALTDSLTDERWDFQEKKSPVGVEARIRRHIGNFLPVYSDDLSSGVLISQGLNGIPEHAVGAATRIQRSISALESSVGAEARIRRAVTEPWNTFEGEHPYQMYKRSSEETENSSTPDENADKNSNSTKKTLLIIHRPPILYHPPSHMIHRPAIVVHRPDIIVHRHPIVFHRPPILVHRPPIIIHRQPVLIHRPPIIVHRPPLVFHRPPIIIHRRPYIIHHHPILFHRPPIIVHRGPQMIVHHSHLIHHYPMHMIHMHCPGCGFGKSTVARIEANRTEQDNKKTSYSDRSLKDATVMDSQRKGSNPPKRSIADKKSKKSSKEYHKKRKDGHKKKKDVVVNRPPIIYHPPPEVYHRPDIVVHRAPILIHRPPIVYHQPPVVVHRPAVVYHQPPIVFHQPAPAVNQPLLFSHDSFVVHPMAFASHMGSVVNDAGHYVGLPHGGVTNFPGSIPHGPTGHVFPSLNSPGWSRRAEVSKPQSTKNAKVNKSKQSKHVKRSAELEDHKNGKDVYNNDKPRQQESKQAKGERKNKVIVARPPLIYHPPPEIYDRPDVVVHRPDIVIHQPSVVYHQPSVVVHRAPVVYQQPPVVFHQPAPMVSQPVYHAHDTYVAHPVYHPHESHIAHSATYVGAPHYYPGHNSYGWGLPGNSPAAPAPQTAQIPQYGYTSASAYPGSNGYTPYPASFGNAFGRSKVENHRNDQATKDDKEVKLKKGKKQSRRRRSAELSKRHLHHRYHHHHHHHHRHHHDHHHHGSKRFYHFRPISSFAHIGHRKHVVVIHRPPLIYHPPTQVYRQPDILMHLPPLVYHRPPVMFHQPPTVVHHPAIVYHQPPVVFHNPPSIVQTPVIHSHEMLSPHIQHVMVPTASYMHPAGNYFGPVFAGSAYGKSEIERADAEKGSDTKSNHKTAKADEKREASGVAVKEKTVKKGSKKQNVDLVVHQPPIVYHPPPDIFDKPPVVVHQPPMVVHRAPILIHRAPVVVHRPPVVIHRPPIVLHHAAPIYHVAHGHYFHPMGYSFGKSTIEGEKDEKSKEDTYNGEKHSEKKSHAKGPKQKSTTKKGQRKNMVLIHRPPMIYHPPPEIYDRPDVIVHRPDIVIHRPSVVYHQPSVVVHRPPIIYRQPPVVFHQPAPMVHQPVMHAHDSYVAHPVPVPYTSHIQHAATYVGAPHFFNQPQFGGYMGHAFGKSEVEKVKNSKNKDESKTKKKIDGETKAKSRPTRDADSKEKDKKKLNLTPPSISKQHKKNKVIINRPPMIYHPPPEIYDKPDVIVHRPDIVIHRPSIVYHQPSVVVHRPPIVYQAPSVVFHQPPPLVNQPIMHAHDTYVAHPVPVPYSSHIQHTSTYVGSPHHYPGGWNYGWSQPHPFGLAYGKSNVPATKHNSSKHSKLAENNKVKRAAKDEGKKGDENVKQKSAKGKKKNQVLIQRPPLIYHPPPEVYHKPDVIVHRPDIVIHRPSVIYHHPSVVVHRPPVVYHQPPVVFHQPSAMVSQPVLHAHDTYVAHPFFSPYSSDLYHGGSYVGAPNVYNGGWGGHGYGLAHAFGKSKVEGAHKKKKHHKDKSKDLKGSRRTLAKEVKEAEDEIRLKNETKNVTGGDKKNLVVMRRPPLIYHPPPEVYHKPDVIMHRPDIVIHRPSIVFHQPSVVVHRPPVIYQQPPVVFHQPSPMVHQPILHSHDTYIAHPHFVPFTSHVHHTESYVGAPHFYPGHWGFGGHGYGFHNAFGKSKVEKASKHQRKSRSDKEKDGHDRDGEKRTLPVTRDTPDNDKLNSKKKATTKGHKKNLVIMRRPPLIYHPPPEVYHKPDVILHRPDIVIHRPSVVFHQPSIVVHRPPVIYHQPPVVFHQPSPMVHQPIFHSHETYLAHPHFVPSLSHITHAGSYVGAPHFYPGHWGSTHGFGHFMGHAFGKSKVEKGTKKGKFAIVKKGNKNSEVAVHEKIRREATDHDLPKGNQKSKLKVPDTKVTSAKGDKKETKLHPEKEDKKVHHKAHRKNLVLVQRPTLIYHPPPEIYDRPDIIVHRPDVVIHQPSVVYHQPSVVVHRPPIIYHPPPVVFHQPAPMVHQPTYTSHDVYHSHPHFVPYASHVRHTQTYIGAPNYYPGGWRYGYGFPENSIAQQVGASRWNVLRTPSPLYQANYVAPTRIATPNTIRSRYRSAFAKSDVQKHHEKAEDPKKNHTIMHKENDNKKPHQFVAKEGKRNRRSVELRKRSTKKTTLHKKGHKTDEGGKKNLVLVKRPSLVYHPPPEIYHKPDVIVHRPDVVIHQPSVVYHQPSAVVHRPTVIYNQPPVVFHQPAPTVNQPIFHAHENYMAHAAFVPYVSSIQHSGTYVGAPEFFHGEGSLGYGHAFGKSQVVKHESKSSKQSAKSYKKSKISTKRKVFHPQEKKDEKASRKNNIVVSRPPIIYHPPPEIYHRPDIVVHRAPIVLHRPPIIYHQPPVVVHRPAVVYHQPPVIFHQPPPTVHQPILHSHDSFVVRPAARFFPQGSTLTHSMSYVGIPNHVVHGDELGFHHFQRSQIEHTGKHASIKKPSTAQVAKSTISKMPTTNKENTETTITDQTQKKTLRSAIHHHRLSKRQLIGSHSLFGSLSPINKILDSQKSVEQTEKLSTIPGDTSDRENNIAKRQLILPESTENIYHTSLPSVYNTLEMAALQNQALAASDGLPQTNGVDEVHFPGIASSLQALQGLQGTGMTRYPFPLQHYLQAVPKGDSPDVRVHVETAKSSIPLNVRTKRQILPLYQQQVTSQIPRVLYQSSSLGDLGGATPLPTPSSVYHLFSPYHAMYHPVADQYHYLGIPSPLLHRPHVNINVQSARSMIPDVDHVIKKRSDEKKSKRQFLAVVPPLSPGLSLGLGAGLMSNYLPFSPYSALSRFPYLLLPRLGYPEESESDSEETTFPEALPLLRHPLSIPHTPYSAFSGDEDNDSPSFNPVASYLTALYNSYLGYPFYHRHHKPKVHVEVHASKSQIPKATDNKQDVHSRISKRQLYNYLPASPLIANHYPLPAALNYGIQGFHHNSPHVNINVETAKRHGIPSGIKERRSPVAAKRKPQEETQTGDKRDELLEDGGNGQEISPYQANPNFANAPENQFVATSESSEPQEIVSNDERIQALPQQQLGQETAGQQQDQQQDQQQEQQQEQQQDQQNSAQQQPVPFPNQPMAMPFQAQQLGFRAPLETMQVQGQAPIQLSTQPAFNVPVVAPYMAPIQGFVPSALPGVSSISTAEQSGAQQTLGSEEGQPKHTSINVNVAAKSIVPTKKSKKSKKSHGKRQLVASPQGNVPVNGIPNPYTGDTPLQNNNRPRVSINVETAKKSALENDPEKRQSISLLTRFPAMQVLPQTFKQNGVLMPAFNTLPVNHRIKANGMLLEELQRQRKHQIPKTAKGTKTASQRGKINREKGKQKENAKKRQFYVVPQSTLPVQQYVLASQPSIHQRPKVSVNVEVNKRKSEFPQGKYHERKQKRQVYGIEQLPHMVQMPLANTPLLPQIPFRAQPPRVSVHVETAKRKTLGQKEHTSKGKRQIYGLSELPHEGMLQPFSLASQSQPLGYLPRTLHSPHVSINVEASKRSEDGLQDDIHKRQVLGVQPNRVEETLEQDQEPVPPGQASFQSDEMAQDDTAQNPIHVQEQPQEDELSSEAIQSSPEAAQQQQQQQQQEQQQQQQQQQVEELPSGGVPSQAVFSDILDQRPRVSIHVEASKRGKTESKQKHHKSKSTMSEHNDQAKKQETGKKTRRQLFGTVPLLISLGQNAEHGEKRKMNNARSFVPQSVGNLDRKDRLLWKRQLYNYLGGQQEQQIVPTQAIQDTADAEQQPQGIPMPPVQVFQQDNGAQTQLAQVNLPQASLLESSNQLSPQQYAGQTEVPENSQQASTSSIQSEPSLSPLGALHRPHVSINVQTAKSKVPTPVKAKRTIAENQSANTQADEKQKFKRQFDVLGGGGILERRRGPKFLAAPLKKTRPGNLFGLGSNLNKPVEVFADPIANLVAGGRKRPKLGGIRIDSPTGVGPLPLRGGFNPLGGTLANDVGAPAIIQDNAAEAIAPFVQEPPANGGNPFSPPSGIAGPRIDAIGKGDNGDLSLADLPPNRPAIFPLPALNQAVMQSLPFAAAAPPPQERPLFLAPRVLPVAPIVPLASPIAVPPPPVPAVEDTGPELPHAPQTGPILPPVIPMPLPNALPPPPLPNSESLFPESDDDKPSVHVNVETSRSHVPDRKAHSKQHASGQASRG